MVDTQIKVRAGWGDKGDSRVSVTLYVYACVPGVACVTLIVYTKR